MCEGQWVRVRYGQLTVSMPVLGLVIDLYSYHKKKSVHVIVSSPAWMETTSSGV